MERTASLLPIVERSTDAMAPNESEKTRKDMPSPAPSPLFTPTGAEEVSIRRNQSKYDYVKVRVWVQDHFYVLSRYLVCRALVSTKITSRDAVQISLDLKRTLVDLGLTDIVQEQFEDFLYKTMQVFGYGESHITCYRMMSSLHRKRVPLLIILAGTACVGKSTLATKLADRLNLSSVLQTDLTHELMCNFSGRQETAYTTTSFASKDDLIAEYKEDCETVRRGVRSDIDKCLKEGKSLIIEGFHIDPRLYQKEIAVDSGVSGIVVPFLLTLDAPHHREFMTNSPDVRYRSQHSDTAFENLQTVQDYLVAHTTEPDITPFTTIAINIHSFHDTLDRLHDIILERIEAMAGNIPET
ncbi:hypothetical protein Poli38472_000518 [Pythium oligandrum]|uniref:2-phosphoglycerate kinase n=1 Tax=Pythium oligandrum TaxID=41045 RepID=A0A8K1CCM3_PYTOL|nr:hypothetical protein Poli38472_000518 [Pythium oligandrum]|eukprot:TMW60476.1 hypothetical protein Poli38472_000518 [Pythium oligandrum]